MIADDRQSRRSDEQLREIESHVAPLRRRCPDLADLVALGLWASLQDDVAPTVLPPQAPPPAMVAACRDALAAQLGTDGMYDLLCGATTLARALTEERFPGAEWTSRVLAVDLRRAVLEVPE
jgi:hypothetical protein